MSGALWTFVASFREPHPRDGRHFHELLWNQLRMLAALDDRGWDPDVSSDPHSDDFCFSFAGTALFVVGLSPAAQDPARRFAYPTLVFNPNEQFGRLRADGRFERWKRVIRRRGMALRGGPNPLLADHGVEPGWRQYSMVAGQGECPFPHGADRARAPAILDGAVREPGVAQPVLESTEHLGDASDGEGAPGPVETFVHTQLRAFAEAHPCIGARQVIRGGTYRFRLLDRLGGAASTTRLAGDLGRFADDLVRSRSRSPDRVATDPLPYPEPSSA